MDKPFGAEAGELSGHNYSYTGGGQELEPRVLMEVKSLFILLPRLVFLSDEL